MKLIKEYEVAKQAGLSASHFSEILKGKKNPGDAISQKLADTIEGTTAEFWRTASSDEKNIAVLKFRLKDILPLLCKECGTHESMCALR